MNKRIIKFFDEENNLDVEFELIIGDSDFWEEKRFRNKVYDIHYCEDYNEICVYPVKDGETIFISIYSESIESKVYQPKLDKDDWGILLHKSEVYLDKLRCEEDFPDYKVVEKELKDIENPIFVD